MSRRIFTGAQTQLKAKAMKQHANVSAGLLPCPTLMAADILLYQTDLVPVGKGQQQHLELTREGADKARRRAAETMRQVRERMGIVGA